MAPNTVSDNGQQNPRREGDLGIGKGRGGSSYHVHVPNDWEVLSIQTAGAERVGVSVGRGVVIVVQGVIGSYDSTPRRVSYSFHPCIFF